MPLWDNPPPPNTHPRWPDWEIHGSCKWASEISRKPSNWIISLSFGSMIEFGYIICSIFCCEQLMVAGVDCYKGRCRDGKSVPLGCFVHYRVQAKRPISKVLNIVKSLWNICVWTSALEWLVKTPTLQYCHFSKNVPRIKIKSDNNLTFWKGLLIFTCMTVSWQSGGCFMMGGSRLVLWANLCVSTITSRSGIYRGFSSIFFRKQKQKRLMGIEHTTV